MYVNNQQIVWNEEAAHDEQQKLLKKKTMKLKNCK